MKDSSICFLSDSDYSDLTCPHPTVLQTSATNSQFGEVAKFSTEGTVMNCQTGKYIQHQSKNKPYHMKERLISYQFHVLD